MGNITQGAWTLYGALLILNFLNINEQTIAAERHWVVEGTAELNQPIYYRHVVGYEWKFRMENVLPWRRGYSFVSIRNKGLWISSRLTDQI